MTVHTVSDRHVDVLAAPGLREAAEALLLAAVPEFLGALAAALVIAAAGRCLRRLRHRRALSLNDDRDE
ncbi:hypothetical protein AB0D04_00035 [Streptomyces sp. NPDC048483]|uniref:hypothetical protein n=1 Tax=Streptomyces sp. NPDC048483 TaxID=3154927 RepID=UPI00342FBA5B